MMLEFQSVIIGNCKNSMEIAHIPQLMKENDGVVFAFLIYHVIKIGWFQPIVELSRDEDKLESGLDLSSNATCLFRWLRMRIPSFFLVNR